MAYTTINKSSLHFNTKLYTGNGSAGHSITGVGFQPDFVWIKQRDSRDHFLFNAISTATKYVASNTTAAEATDANTLTAFGADGFTLGSGVGVNENNDTHVSWNWKAGTTGSGNTTGSGTYKTYSYSVNTTAGFSIVKYVGNGSAGQQIPHHLGAVPHLILLKPLDRADNWRVYHHKNTSAPETDFLKLQSTAATVDNNDVWNDAAPTSTYFTLGGNAGVQANDEEFIAYCFSEKTGYSKFGSYVGNGNDNGTFVYTGFKPAFVMVKATSATSDWNIMDDKRAVSFNPNTKELYANSSGAEATGGETIRDYLSNGFKLRGTSGGTNGNGVSYIYIAFASAPLVGSNNVPCTAR